MTNIAIVILFLLGTNLTLTAQNIPGIVPIQNPTGGFEVDNDPFSNTPTLGVGDWFAGSIGNGGSLFTALGVPIDPTMTTFCQDTWGTKDPTSFLTSNKINDDPSTYSWGLGNVPNKNEIENAVVHFSWGDPTITGGNANDLWCVFAGDRQVTNGASYIDFEFLQKPLTETGTIATGGSFISLGTDGGRTAGDVLVTIEFVRGGGEANAVVNIWQDADIDGITDGTFEYLPHPNSDYLGDIYMTSNTTETNNIPFDVYGKDYYVINQWAEGAINLSAFFNPNGTNNCFELSTVFVRTRTSGLSDKSELKDFPCPPIQLDFLNLKLVCPTDITLPACSSEAEITAAYNDWVAGFSYKGGRNPITDNKADIPVLPDNYKCGVDLTFTYTVTDNCETKECTSTFTVLPDEEAPVITQATGEVDGSDLGCNPIVEAPTFGATDNCGVGEVIVTTNGPSNDGCAYTQTWMANVSDNCENPASEVTVTFTWTEDTEAPVITQTTGEVDGTDLGCNPIVEAPTFGATDNCGVGEVIVTTNGPTNDGCAYTQTWMANVSDNCGNPAEQVSVTLTWTVDITDPIITSDIESTDLGCNPETITAPKFTLTETCSPGDIIITGDAEPVVDGCMYSQTWIANFTDDCENVAEEVVVTLTWTVDITDPIITSDIESTDLGCNPETITAPEFTLTETCSPSDIIITGDAEPVVDGCMYSQTWIANFTDDCENAAEEVVVTLTWTVDTEAPVIQAPDNYTICNDELPYSIDATWTDNCSEGGNLTAIGLPFSTTECATTYSYTFNVTDACENKAEEKVVLITREIDKYTNCETAFAKLDNAICFDEGGFSRWGWTNNISEEGTYHLPLYAGAAQCDITKGALVGQVIVTYENGFVNVEYDLSDGYVMTEAHVYIGCEKYPMKNGKATVAPGQFNFNLGTLDHVYNYSLSPIEVSGPFWIIAHAVTCEEICRCSISEDNGKQFVADSVISCENDNQQDPLKTEFKAYPVPFDDILTVEYKYEYDTDVTIQVFDTKGMLITNDIDTHYIKGKVGSKNLDLSRVSDQTLIVRLVTNKEVQSKLVVAKSVKKRF